MAPPMQRLRPRPAVKSRSKAASSSGAMATASRSGVYRTGAERTFHRPGDRVQARRRLAIPFAADWRVAGIVWREYAAQHELGRVRARASAGDDPAQALRPAVRSTRGRLGESQA